MIIIGIDPGLSGGIGFNDGNTGWAYPMPETERDIYDLLADHKAYSPKAFIELVHAMPGQGVSSMFKFGQHYGMLRAFLIALQIPFETVTPQKWQKTLGCLTKGDKNVSKRKAQELFPDIKVNHKIADALLIAYYGAKHGL